MKHTAEEILEILDACASDFNFPVMDNGYVYLAATRMSLFRSVKDWAIVIEVFGFSPRAGLPDLFISTFGSSIANRNDPSQYATREAYESYLARMPHHDSDMFHPVNDGEWYEEETVSFDAKSIGVRDHGFLLPEAGQYEELGISLEDAPRVAIFELCRYLAAKHRDWVLATPAESDSHVLDSMEKILTLEEWNHPDLTGDEMPSDSETFQQLAEVLVTGDVSLYRPSLPPNTHWVNWPEGGTL